MFVVRHPHHSHHGHFRPEFRGRNHFDLESFFGRPLLVHEHPWSVLARESTPPVPKNSDKKLEKSQLVTLTEDKFEVKLDVSKYTPDELNVKIVDNALVIEGKHEEKDDPNNFVSHNFIRKFQLPEGIILDQMISSLSTEGILVISSPRHIEKPQLNGTTIPITFAGQENQPTAPATSEEDNKSTN